MGSNWSGQDIDRRGMDVVVVSARNLASQRGTRLNYLINDRPESLLPGRTQPSGLKRVAREGGWAL